MNKQQLKNNNRLLPFVKRGEIYYADLGETIGAEQSGLRPVIIVQNDKGNKHSPTVIVLAITSQSNKTSIPPHLKIPKEITELTKDSIILGEQIRTIDKQRLKQRIAKLPEEYMKQVDEKIKISLNLI